MLDTITGMLGLGTHASIQDRAQAFDDLYRVQFDRVYAYLRYRLGDPVLAEDLASEVFIRAWSKLDDLRSPERVVAWLFTTARNLAADHYRQKRPCFPLEELPAEQHPRVGPPDDLVLTAEQVARVRQYLEELGERQREVVGLRFVAGLRNCEIARIIGTSEGNVALILHRALRKLRERLAAEVNDV